MITKLLESELFSQVQTELPEFTCDLLCLSKKQFLKRDGRMQSKRC